MKYLLKLLICLLTATLLLTACFDEEGLSSTDLTDAADTGNPDVYEPQNANGGSVYLHESVYAADGSVDQQDFAVFAKVDKGVLMNMLYNGKTVAEWEELLESLEENPYRAEYQKAMSVYSGMLDQVLVSQYVPGALLAPYSELLRAIVGDASANDLITNGASLEKLFILTQNLSSDQLSPSNPYYQLVITLEAMRDQAIAQMTFPDYNNMTYSEFYDQVVLPSYQKMQEWDANEGQMRDDIEENYDTALQTLSESYLIAALGEQGILARPTTMDITSFSYSSYVDDCDPAYYQKNPGSYYRNTGGTVTCLIQTDLPTLEALVPVGGVHATVYGGQITEKNGLTFVYGLWDYLECQPTVGEGIKYYDCNADWMDYYHLQYIELTPDGRATYYANDRSMIIIDGRYDDYGITLSDGTRIPFASDGTLTYDGLPYYLHTDTAEPVLTVKLETASVTALKYKPTADRAEILENFQKMVEGGYVMYEDPVPEMNRNRMLQLDLKLPETVSVTSSSLVQYTFPAEGATADSVVALEYEIDLSQNSGSYTTFFFGNSYGCYDGYCLHLELSDGSSADYLFVFGICVYYDNTPIGITAETD
ncbi:MAG: hypothetical protein ACI3XR_03620 [Eubacteriales bacterium]